MTEEERHSRVAHFNAGAVGDLGESSWEAEGRSQVRALHGTKDIEQLFPGQALKTTVPWPTGSRKREEPKYDQAAVTAELIRPPRTVEIDPRILSAGQPHVIRPGVEHYLKHLDYTKTGTTYADPENVGNQFPFVVTKRGTSPNMPEHEHLIISGHHRAAAALLRGEKLRTRWIEQE